MKKLLITLGCSYTEGVGCYDPELIAQYSSINDSNRGEIFDQSLERFHSNGWPVRLQKKLNYHKLINLGKYATGESYQLKRFIEEFGAIDLKKEYDVLIVWLISPPGRISFYSSGKLRSVMCNWTHADDISNNMANAYLNLINDIDLDTVLEQAFYVKTMKEICDGKGYNFVVFPTNGSKLFINDSHSNPNNILDIPENMSLYYGSKSLKEKYTSITYVPDDYLSITGCRHPNENGYELIANRMFDTICLHNSKLINENIPEVFESEWRGPKQW